MVADLLLITMSLSPISISKPFDVLLTIFINSNNGSKLLITSVTGNECTKQFKTYSQLPDPGDILPPPWAQSGAKYGQRKLSILFSKFVGIIDRRTDYDLYAEFGPQTKKLQRPINYQF